MNLISMKRANGRLYAYRAGRFWVWNDEQHAWKESHLMAQKYALNHEADKLLTPENFLTDPAVFSKQDAAELPKAIVNALERAQPCQSAPIEPVKETAVVPAQGPSPAVVPEEKPTVSDNTPAFDYTGLDTQTVDTLHMAERQYTQGKKMAETGLRWMVNAVAMAHDALCGGVVPLWDELTTTSTVKITSGLGAPLSVSASPLPTGFSACLRNLATFSWTASPFWMSSPPPCCMKRPSPVPRRTWYRRSRPVRLPAVQSTEPSSKRTSSSALTA